MTSGRFKALPISTAQFVCCLANSLSCSGREGAATAGYWGGRVNLMQLTAENHYSGLGWFAACTKPKGKTIRAYYGLLVNIDSF